MAFGAKGASGKKKFTYVPPDDNATRKRAESKGGQRDGFIRDDIKMFAPGDKTNRVRFFPWTGEERPHHYGQDVYVHYGIGPDNGSYLCLFKMYNEPCPICEARKQAEEEGDEDTAKALRATYRVVTYMVDRSKEQEGPKIWAMPYTVDANICSVSVDEDTKEIYHIDDPDNGYDAFITREGTGRNTKYSGEKISRKPSTLHADAKVADAWMDFVVENPIEEILIKRDYDYIKSVFAGGTPAARKEEEKKEDKPAPTSGLKKKAKEPEPEPEEVSEVKEEVKEEAVPEKEDADLSWDGLHAMERDILVELLVQENVPEEEYAEMSKEEIADAICDMYDIVKPEPKPKEKQSLKDKIKNRKK